MPPLVLFQTQRLLSSEGTRLSGLQELTAARGLGVPEYVVGEGGPDHAKSFTAAAMVGGELHGEGAGRSKKEAEQQAAEAAWRSLTAGA